MPPVQAVSDGPVGSHGTFSSDQDKTLLSPEKLRSMARDGKWHKYRIHAPAGDLTLSIDDMVTTKVLNHSHHSNKDATSALQHCRVSVDVEFKDIRLKKLSKAN
jgi:hypothetical protein